MTMTYKEMAIEKLFMDNVCDLDVSRELLELHDILKDVTYIDKSFLYTQIKPVLTKKTLVFMRDSDALMRIYNSKEGIEVISERNITNLFSRFIDGRKMTDAQINGLCTWTLMLIKPFAKKWKQKVIEVANDIKENS